jgi:hypothetical protein
MIDCARTADALADHDPDAHQADFLKGDEQRSELTARFPTDSWLSPAFVLPQASRPVIAEAPLCARKGCLTAPDRPGDADDGPRA